jgi:hypothetical protein
MAINYVSAQAVNVSSLTTVYNPTTSGVQATLIGCLLANTGGTPVTATVTLTNAAATTTTNIISNVVIPNGNSLDILNTAKIVIPQNYTLKVSSTGTVDVTISSVEVS